MASFTRCAVALAAVLAAATAGSARAEKTVLSVGMAAIDAGRLDPHLSADDAGQGAVRLDVQRPRAHEAGHDEPDPALI